MKIRNNDILIITIIFFMSFLFFALESAQADYNKQNYLYFNYLKGDNTYKITGFDKEKLKKLVNKNKRVLIYSIYKEFGTIDLYEKNMPYKFDIEKGRYFNKADFNNNSILIGHNVKKYDDKKVVGYLSKKYPHYELYIIKSVNLDKILEKGILYIDFFKKTPTELFKIATAEKVILDKSNEKIYFRLPSLIILFVVVLFYILFFFINNKRKEIALRMIYSQNNLYISYSLIKSLIFPILIGISLGLIFSFILPFVKLRINMLYLSIIMFISLFIFLTIIIYLIIVKTEITYKDLNRS